MDDLHVAIAAAHAGAEVITEYFGASPDPEYKGKFDPVTAVDRAAEDAIVEVIAKARPDDALLAEESGGRTGTGRHWIIDPLDGTVNFVHGIPHISVSIALYEGTKGLVGVVYDPLRDELFTACDGDGARLNGHVISVSDVTDIGRSIVATGFPYDHDVRAESLSIVVREMLREINGLRRMGSAALDLAWVAAGRYDAYWELGIAPWDGAAGMVLVREAGGIVTDPFGRRSSPLMGLVVSSNGHLHDQIRSIVEAWMPADLVQP
jgi:myo-inositol-1(or 4)-monophosphatase